MCTLCWSAEDSTPGAQPGAAVNCNVSVDWAHHVHWSLLSCCSWTVLSSVLRLQKREIALEVLNYRKNGEKFWNLLSLMPVKDACGNVVSFIGVQSDITELIRRKHAERELQQAKVHRPSHHLHRLHVDSQHDARECMKGT